MPAIQDRPPLPDGPYLIVGLARSGQAAAILLAARGERVIAVDSGSPEGAEALRDAGVTVHLETNGERLVEGVGCVVKSPGVPRQAPAVAAALSAGLPLIGELELAWRLLSNRFVAVTGTNGKSTAVEMLGHAWRTAGLRVAVAGNVGTPLASLVGNVGPEATIVCECSSFQLEDAERFRPECAVLLNVTPDHLDRHGDLAAYAAAKLRIFANQVPTDVAIFDGAELERLGLEPGGEGQRLDLREQPQAAKLAAATRLIGPHNHANAHAVAAAALACGIDAGTAGEGIATFEGIPHRLERVAERDGVLFVNDSKATNVAAAVAALRSFEGGVRAILGGSLKGAGFTGLAEPVAERCASCYLIGPAADPIEQELAPAAAAGVAVKRAADLAAAVEAAAADARPGDVVLLAPACASFDAFRDFEHRGEAFRDAVAALGEGTE